MKTDQQSLVNWAYQKVVESNGDERGIKLAIAGVLVEAERPIADLQSQLTAALAERDAARGELSNRDHVQEVTKIIGQDTETLMTELATLRTQLAECIGLNEIASQICKKQADQLAEREEDGRLMETMEARQWSPTWIHGKQAWYIHEQGNGYIANGLTLRSALRAAIGKEGK